MKPITVAFSGLAGAVIAALVGWIGNYLVVKRVHGLHIRLDRLRHSLYDFLDLTTRYWLSIGVDGSKRRSLEAEILVAQNVISTEYSLLAKRYKGIEKSYKNTEEMRVVLWDAATGGCFQQEQWKTDPERARAVSNAVTAVVKSLD